MTETAILMNLRTQEGLISAIIQMNAVVTEHVLVLDGVQVQATVVLPSPNTLTITHRYQETSVKIIATMTPTACHMTILLQLGNVIPSMLFLPLLRTAGHGILTRRRMIVKAKGV